MKVKLLTNASKKKRRQYSVHIVVTSNRITINHMLVVGKSVYTSTLINSVVINGMPIHVPLFVSFAEPLELLWRYFS